MRLINRTFHIWRSTSPKKDAYEMQTVGRGKPQLEARLV